MVGTSEAAHGDGLVVSTTGGVATVRLDRPARRNALSAPMIEGLRKAMASSDADPAVHAVVLTGTDPAFCAGLDLHELAGSGANIAAAGVGRPWAPMRVPVIGAVNGAAMTGGLELVLNCDMVIASERAFFADTHALVGVMPGWGLSVLLPRAVGIARAKEMSATSRRVPAELALRWGLVNHVVAHGELMPAALAIAAAIGTNNPTALAALLALYEENTGLPYAVALEHEADVHAEWLERTGRPSPEMAERLARRGDRSAR